MDSRYIDYLLTDAESDQFERDGYFAVENALSKDMVDDLVVIVDRIDREERLRMNGDPADRTTIRVSSVETPSFSSCSIGTSPSRRCGAFSAGTCRSSTTSIAATPFANSCSGSVFPAVADILRRRQRTFRSKRGLRNI